MPDPTPAEVVHDRLKGLLIHLKPKLALEGVDQDRLDQLRRLSDVRIRKFAVSKPQITGADLAGLLADPRTGRFDELSDETGVLCKGHFSLVLPTLGEDMGYLVEACLTLQVIGRERMKSYAAGFVAQKGPVSAGSVPAPAAPAKPAVAPLPPAVAKVLGAVEGLWTAPPSTLKALELLRSAETPADAVCSELEKDPALAAQILRLVNTSPHGAAAKVSSIKRAVVSLGYPLIRRFAMTAALLARLAPPYGESGFDARAFWGRSLCLAHAAAQISRSAKLGHPDEHYSAGLLHAVGRLAEAKGGRKSAEAPVSELGAAILERWRFPAGAVEAARHAADSADVLEELQIPREAVVVAAFSHLADGADPAPWVGLLRVAAPVIPLVLETAGRAAEAGAAELAG